MWDGNQAMEQIQRQRSDFTDALFWHDLSHLNEKPHVKIPSHFDQLKLFDHYQTSLLVKIMDP
jgi:exopolysaccharide biosynthesis predicted pyruvyltransferase EpsI